MTGASWPLPEYRQRLAGDTSDTNRSRFASDTIPRNPLANPVAGRYGLPSHSVVQRLEWLDWFMRLLVQRVASAEVTVNGEVAGQISGGLLGFFCSMSGDRDEQVGKLARKFVNLRVFRDDAGRMNQSLLQIGGEALIVSQFTLAADTSRGNRPGFSGAASPDIGERQYEDFCDAVRNLGVGVETGVFGAEMEVKLKNDGPVTILLEC